MDAGDDHLRDARGLHRAGRLGEAAALYRQALAVDPRDATALNLLGVVCDASGDSAQAVALIGQALLIRETASFHCNLGMALGHLGRHEEALACYDRALVMRPDYPEALINQGVSLEALHRATDAEIVYRRAIACRPGNAAALGNLGNALRSLGRFDEAVSAYEAAVAQAPTGQAGGLPDTYANLGHVLQQLGRLADAVAACERALAMAPENTAALNNLGNALRELGRLEESETALRRLVALRPAGVDGYNNLAITLQAQDRPHEALAVLDLAAALDPEDAETHHHRAMLLLRHGRFAEGWALYDWRFRTKQSGGRHRQFTNAPSWRGEQIAGQTILLIPEQGFGDVIQFSRYVPLVAAGGARVLLGIQAPLRRLMNSLSGVAELVEIGETLPPYQHQCPLLSLPRAFETTLDSMPGGVPYLHGEPDALARWATRLDVATPGLRVGVVWAGNPRHLGDRQRSIPFAALAPLWQVPGVRWFSLQVGVRQGDPTAKGAILPCGGIEDLAPELIDFSETAAALAGLDLLIAVDTAVVHLAGALGVPVWVMLPRVPDWRWLRAGDGSPWYPSMRLFRQDDRRSWSSVLKDISEALSVQASGATGRPGTATEV